MKKERQSLSLLLFFLNTLAICLAYPIALFIRFTVMNGVRSFPYDHPLALFCVFIYALLLSTGYSIFNVFDASSFQKKGQEIFVIFALNILGASLVFSILFLLRLINFSRVFLVIFSLCSCLLSLLTFILFRNLTENAYRSGKNQKHYILFGNGALAANLVSYSKSHPESGILIDGYVSRSLKPNLGDNLGPYEDIDCILEKYNPTALIIALESHETEFIPMAMNAADKEGIGVFLVPFFHQYLPSQPVIDKVGDINLMDLRATPLDNVFARLVKRIVDIFGSVFLIIITSPIMLLTAIGVRLSSPGPILFKQQRVGKDKKLFNMYKFRSMLVTDSQDTGWTTGDDPRKTRFGSFIRKYSIDELPQFFNVLLGNMSLVGPRPEVPFHVYHFKENIPRYLVRQQVKPGITGWAQVHGLRGDTSIETRVEYDLWYIENWSLLLDIRILLMTLFGGLKNNEVVK